MGESQSLSLNVETATALPKINEEPGEREETAFPWATEGGGGGGDGDADMKVKSSFRSFPFP